MNGYSADNYIIDQDYFGDYTYRTIKVSRNGCGPIAVYNILKYLGREKPLAEIVDEMDSMYSVKIPGPTTMKVMRQYIKKYLPEMNESYGRKNCFNSMRKSVCGIIRYTESGIPHFVSYFRDGDDLRFFNVETGFEDYRTSAETFFERVLPGYTALFSVK